MQFVDFISFGIKKISQLIDGTLFTFSFIQYCLIHGVVLEFMLLNPSRAGLRLQSQNLVVKVVNLLKLNVLAVQSLLLSGPELLAQIFEKRMLLLQISCELADSPPAFLNCLEQRPLFRIELRQFALLR